MLHTKLCALYSFKLISFILLTLLVTVTTITCVHIRWARSKFCDSFMVVLF